MKGQKLSLFRKYIVSETALVNHFNERYYVCRIWLKFKAWAREQATLSFDRAAKPWLITLAVVFTYFSIHLILTVEEETKITNGIAVGILSVSAIALWIALARSLSFFDILMFVKNVRYFIMLPIFGVLLVIMYTARIMIHYILFPAIVSLLPQLLFLWLSNTPATAVCKWNTLQLLLMLLVSLTPHMILLTSMTRDIIKFKKLQNEWKDINDGDAKLYKFYAEVNDTLLCLKEAKVKMNELAQTNDDTGLNVAKKDNNTHWVIRDTAYANKTVDIDVPDEIPIEILYHALTTNSEKPVNKMIFSLIVLSWKSISSLKRSLGTNGGTKLELKGSLTGTHITTNLANADFILSGNFFASVDDLLIALEGLQKTGWFSLNRRRYQLTYGTWVVF